MIAVLYVSGTIGYILITYFFLYIFPSLVWDQYQEDGDLAELFESAGMGAVWVFFPHGVIPFADIVVSWIRG